MIEKTIVLAWILMVVGMIEVGANSWFLNRFKIRKDLSAAKTFHGDFPGSASNAEWLMKIWVMLIIGALALTASWLIFAGNGLAKVFIGLFAAGILGDGIFQATKYGSKHGPALGSLLIGFIFAVLSYFFGLRLTPGKNELRFYIKIVIILLS